jgi:cob(I)alamin adenosyltransferase
VADFSELQIQTILTVGEMRELVALVNLAAEHLPEGQVPEIVHEISDQYFQLMENLTTDGLLGDFQPE